MVLYISALSVVTSPFSFLILLIKVFSPHLLKEPALSFIDLCHCLLHLFFIYNHSDLYDLFPSTNFVFCDCCSFSSCFRCKVFDVFLVSLGRLALL